MKLPVSAIIMTYNEQINLPKCLESIAQHIDDIVIVDSFSTDNTCEIASKYTPKIYRNNFVNQAKQFIWTLANTDIQHEWMIRIDADERWTSEGFAELRRIIERDEADGV